jgi:hypothetical protein
LLLVNSRIKPFGIKIIMKNLKTYSKKLLLPVIISIFTTGVVNAANQVDLGAAGSFTILSKTGITNVYKSAITGDVGTSPITGAALLLTCGEVTGDVYTVNASGPQPCVKTNPNHLLDAVSAMGFAYDDAAGRDVDAIAELGAGDISGKELEPGLYKWSTSLAINSDITLLGNNNTDDVWIFQIAGKLDQANATKVILAGGAKTKNIIWQVADAVTIGTGAHFEGTILGKTLIAVNTGASVNGRLLAQTAVTLQMSTVKAQ